MNELTLSLSDNELGIIGNELNRLFLFQDRPFSKDKQAAFLDDIRGWSIPAGAIISGIRKLMAEDLKSLKLATIKGAAREFIAPETVERSKCDFCWGNGVILMKDERHYEFALACQCSNAPKDLKRWSGEERQFSNGRWLTLRFTDVLEAVKKREE